MVARDITTNKATEPVPYKKNPNYKKDDGSPEFLPAEPHIGLSGVSDDPKPPTYQTGVVRGGTTNPPEGQSGDVERVTLKPGDADPVAEKLDNGDRSAFDKAAEDAPTTHQKILNDEIDDSKSTKSSGSSK